MSWRDGLRHRLRVWLRAESYAREQLEERRFHRDMELADGRSPDFDPDPHLPSLREDRFMWTRLFDWLRQDLGYAVRTLARSPAFTAVAVLTLGLGVGANAAVFSVLDRLIGQPPAGLTDPHDLRRLYIQRPNHPLQPGLTFPFWNYPAYTAVDEAVGDAADVALWTPSTEIVLQSGGADLTARVSYVTHDYFDVLGVRPAAGRLFGVDEERVEVPAPVAVLTHAFWQRAFGADPGVVGRTLERDGVGFTIVGITGDGFAGLDLSATDVFLPASTYPGSGQLGLPWYRWIGSPFHAVARVPDVAAGNLLAARATAGYHRQELPERGAAPLDSTARVVPGSIIEARGVGREAGTAEQRQALAISIRAAGVSAIVLLIACANVAGLVLVRTARRRRETAVRLALGISRKRLAAQFLIEGVLLGLLGAGVALLLGAWGAGVLRALLTPDVVWSTAVVEQRLVLFVIATSLAVGLLSSLPPLFQGRTAVGAGLRSGGRSGPSRSPFQSALLAAQGALSVVLLIGAGLFVASLRNVAALRLGFDVDRLAWINPGRPLDPANAGQALQDVATDLARIEGVSGIALAAHPPMLGSTARRVFLAGGDSLPAMAPGTRPTGNIVSPEFFAVTGMQIRQGRTFAVGEEAVVIVSETMARTLWPGQGAVGKCIVFGEPTDACHIVVGVVEDSRRRSLIEEPTLQYFLPRPPGTAGGAILLRADPRRWDAVAAGARQILERSFDARTARLARMMETLEPQLRPWRLGAQLFTAFGILALLVTLVGVYGVMAYAVSQRTREIGVRMAVGAQGRDVVRLILADGVTVVGVGVLAGVALALALGRLVDALLYGVTPREPAAIAAAATVLLLTAAAASVIPAWRAARVDPATTLREE